MTDLKKFSKEWFASNVSKDQRTAIEKASKKITKSYLNDVDISLKPSVFTGSAEEVQKKLEQGRGLNYLEREIVNQVGAKNLISIMDINKDGNISESEVADVSFVDNDDLDDLSLAKLSANDIKQIYENAVAAKGADTGTNGDTTIYRYKDGSTAIIREDENGKVVYKREDDKTTKTQKHSVTYDMKESTKTEEFENPQTGAKVKIVDKPGKLEDRVYSKTPKSDGTTVFSTETVGKVEESVLDKNGNLINKTLTVKYDSDKKIDDTYQMNIGDCWLLAGVNSLRTTELGRKIIQDSIKHNDDGSVTVTLKGPNKSYTYSAEEIVVNEYDEKFPDKIFAIGDTDMNLIEMAVRDYRKNIQPEDPLDGGTLEESLKILTGKNPSIAVFSFGETAILNKKQKDDGNYALVTFFKYEDYSVGDIMTSHEYSISKVTEDTVYVVNPHDASEQIPYPRDKFMQNCFGLASVDLTKVK